MADVRLLAEHLARFDGGVEDPISRPVDPKGLDIDVKPVDEIHKGGCASIGRKQVLARRGGDRLYSLIVQLRSIPTIGPSGPLTSYIGAMRFLFHSQEMVQEGYDKFRGSVFMIPTLTSWIMIVSGPEFCDDPFQVEIVKGPLTRNIGAKFADVQDEIIAAFDDLVPIQGDEWTEVTAFNTVMDIVCRASNRMLVGLPLCRDPDWIDLTKQFTMDVIMSAMVLSIFPTGLKPFIAPLLTRVPRALRRGIKHLEPLIGERLELKTMHGKDWSEMPVGIYALLLRPRDTKALVRAILGINFAAIHTTTMSFTFVLYELATRPEYIQPLREEVEAVMKEEGWSKGSVRKLWKVDSFIKECLRVSNVNPVTMNRKVLKDFTFSDGTTVPAGGTVMVPFDSVHTDADNYIDAKTFDGFRFEKMRGNDNENLKHQFVSLSVDYVLFGHGRHACPGRFFVANELKVMLSHVLLNYDIKMGDERGRPKNWKFGVHGGPNTTAKMLFRKRAKSGV
ncbi:Cytochrome P450 [Amanita muscaria]